MNTMAMIQEYTDILAKRTFDYVSFKVSYDELEKDVIELKRLIEKRSKEIERLKKLLDDNNIDYKTDDDKGDEVALSSIKDIKEEN